MTQVEAKKWAADVSCDSRRRMPQVSDVCVGGWGKSEWHDVNKEWYGIREVRKRGKDCSCDGWLLTPGGRGWRQGQGGPVVASSLHAGKFGMGMARGTLLGVLPTGGRP